MHAHRMAGERGAVLMAMLLLGLLLGGALLAARLASTTEGDGARAAITATRLAEAEAALIAWAVSVAPAARRGTTPGLLPFPDRNRDGNYDGRGDCVTVGLNASHLLGRLPGIGDVPPCPRNGLGIDVRDAGGERLWYAVSRNLVTAGGGGPINPDMGAPGSMAHPWIVLRHGNGGVIADPKTGLPVPVAAVVIAPGVALAGQHRARPAPAPQHFLDRVSIDGTLFDNADADGCPDALASPCAWQPSGEEFIVATGASAVDGFNDRLVYITVDELLRAVEKRVLGEVAIALNGYRSTHGVYPWLAPFADPARASYKSDLVRAGLLALHLPGEVFASGFDVTWDLTDTTPSTVARHVGDPAITPPLAEILSGRIEVREAHGRCEWSDASRARCVGTGHVAKYFRRDLGTLVTRSVEVSFDLVDDTPAVTPPSARDVRRRALSVEGSSLRASKFEVRIADDDGIHRGRRALGVDADTGGAIAVSGIRFDLSVVYDDVDDARDELPEWFAENDWHHFVFAAFSADAVAGGDVDGDGDCATPADTCLRLTVDGVVARSDVRAMLISAGPALAHQHRSAGDCDADGVADDFLCAYLEGDNRDRSSAEQADTYARRAQAATFNDLVRVVSPLPPRGRRPSTQAGLRSKATWFD